MPWGKWGLRAAAFSYIALFILIPLFVIAVQGVREGLDVFLQNIFVPQALNALWLSIWTAIVMTFINAAMGTMTAYVLVRYRFPGKELFNSLIDLPFAIPSLVTGVMLVLLYGPQSAIGGFFNREFGFKIIFAPAGIILALLFINYPFVIRTVQPVLARLEVNQQEAAHTLGASSWITFFRVIFPEIRGALITGGLLSFARALGEFGAIIVVGATIKTTTASIYIYNQVEGQLYPSASSVSFVLLFIAFAATLGVDLWIRRQHA